ncbi:MAG: hypothetical protein IJ016_02425 [Elusimicrobiaceae bacterium]|nr:hypothetical protein [Elusimicrobiaceae bacterium]
MEDTEHPVYNLLQQKLNEIDQELAKADISDEVRERLYIWKDLFTYVSMVLNTKKFPHVPKRILDNLQNNIASFNVSIAHNPRMANTVVLYDETIGAVNKIPLFFDKGTLGKGLKSLVDSFNNQAKNSVLDFSNERKNTIEDWNKEKAVLQQSVKTLNDEKISLEKEIDSLRIAISTQQGLNQQAVSTFQQEYKNLKEEQKADIEKIKDSFSNKMQEAEKGYISNADTIISHLNTRKNEVEKLWGIIGQAAVSGQAQSYATRACRLAHFMMFLALIFMAYACYNVYQLTNSIATGLSTIQPGMLLFRLLAAAILFAPAFYCANVAKRQRDREFQLRDFEVKTAALEPFVERMALQANSKADKDKMKIELTKTFFDKEFSQKTKQHGDIFISADMRDSLEKIGKIFHNQNLEKK